MSDYKERVATLYNQLLLDLSILRNKKDVLDRMADAISQNEFDEQWEEILEALESHSQ